MTRPTPQSPWAWSIWRWPVALAVLTTIGLVAALFSDGGAGDTANGVAATLSLASCPSCDVLSLKL